MTEARNAQPRRNRQTGRGPEADMTLMAGMNSVVDKGGRRRERTGRLRMISGWGNRDLSRRLTGTGRLLVAVLILVLLLELILQNLHIKLVSIEILL